MSKLAPVGQPNTGLPPDMVPTQPRKFGFLRRFRSSSTKPITLIGDEEVVDVDAQPDLPDEEVVITGTAPGSSATHAAQGQKKRKDRPWLVKTKKKASPAVSGKIPSSPSKGSGFKKSASAPLVPATPMVETSVNPSPPVVPVVSTPVGDDPLPYAADAGVFTVGEVFNHPRERNFTPTDGALELPFPYAARRDADRNPYDEVSPVVRADANHALMEVYGEYRAYSVAELVGQIPFIVPEVGYGEKRSVCVEGVASANR